MLEVDAIIAALGTKPSETAILVDYDGSLSPIVDVPDAAVPLPASIDALRALNASVARVAIVSGRPVEFLAEHVAIPGLVYAGLYGMEVLEDGTRRVDPRVVPYTDAVAAAADLADAQLGGLIVERKAGVSVTLHWRTSPSREREALDLAGELARRFGLAELRTRYAIELRPPVPIDKGTAVDALVKGFTVAAFAGDDTGDLAAFAALERARAEGRLSRAVRIGVESEEMPPALPTMVDVLVDGPHGLARLLAGIAARAAAPG